MKEVHDNYFSGANVINNAFPFKSVQIKTSFEKEGRQSKILQKTKDIFKRLIKGEVDIDSYESFQISYELNDSGEYDKFDLLGEKYECSFSVHADTPGRPNAKELFSKATEELDKFIKLNLEI